MSTFTAARLIGAVVSAHLVFACGGVAYFEPATITLDPTTNFQTLTEWESTAQAGALACPPSAFTKTWPNVCPAFSKYADSLFDQVVDLGINRVRLEIYSGIENQSDYFARYLNAEITEKDWVHKYGRSPINDDNDPNHINWSQFHFGMLDHTIETVVLPLKRRVEAKGEKFFINLCLVHFGTSETGFYQYENPSEYAEFILATYLHMETKYHFLPDAIEVLLEPDNTQFDGTKMGNAIEATITRLETAGFRPRFIVPSTTNAANAVPYFNAIKKVVGDSKVRGYVREISYHRYDGASHKTLEAISTLATTHGIGASMLEWTAGYPELHEDLTVGGNTAWAQYVIAGTYFWGSADTGGSYFKIDDTTPDSPKIHMMSRTKFIRQYTKFIRPGAVRIGAKSDSGTLDAVAFRNNEAHGGGYVVVIKSDGGRPIAVQGLPAGSYGSKYTTSTEYDIDSPDVTIAAGQTLNARIPQLGVITIYKKSSASKQSSESQIK